MKFSILIAAFILGIASFFGYERHQKIETLKTEWQVLVAEAESKAIPSDPTVAFSPERAAQRQRTREREQYVEDFVEELLVLIKESQDPETAKSPEFMARTSEVIDKMLGLSPGELRLMVEGLDQSSSISDMEKQQLTAFAIMMLSNDHPESALTLILETTDTKLNNTSMRDQMLQMALGGLAQRDPMAAAQWLKDNSEKVGGVNSRLSAGIITQASLQDINLAFGLIDDLNNEGKSNLYGAIGNQISIERADEFLTVLRGNKGTDAQKALAMRSLASNQFLENFTDATNWVEKAQLTSEELTDFIDGVDYFEINKNSGEWLEWIVGQEDDSEKLTQVKKDKTKHFIRRWTNDDFVAAGEWITELPSGDYKNQAAHSYADSLKEHEPAAAAQWAETLPESTERGELFTQIHRQWESKDPEAAAAFAEKHGLGAE